MRNFRVAIPRAPQGDAALNARIQLRFGLPPQQFLDDAMWTRNATLNALGVDDFDGEPSPAVRAFMKQIFEADGIADVQIPFDLANVPDLLWNQRGVEVNIVNRPDETEDHNRFAFLLRPLGQGYDDERRILVFQAVPVLYVLRERARDWTAIVDVLFQSGCEFHIVVKGSQHGRTTRAAPLCRTLGIRWPDYQPTLHDFQQWVNLSDEFLTSPRGILAVRAGGLIARIARLVIGNAALRAGADDVDLQSATELRLPGPDQALFYERLTQKEEDLLCGLFLIPTGQKDSTDASGRQNSRLSYFPLPQAFEASGLNVGWWSYNCEKWFCQVLTDMEQGKARLRTQGEWRNVLRKMHRSRKIKQKQNHLGREYLLARCSSKIS
uniref:Uncharacterized protein n=1 Tax=Mycena chlorophos TaxID=658473 RepID=A0ABQ0LYV4_MYCCL|nr:predicted protein [Mycena chlorophos]